MLGWRRPHCFVFLSTFAAQEEVGDGGAHIASAAAAPGGEDGALLRVRGQLLHRRRQHPLVRPQHHRPTTGRRWFSGTGRATRQPSPPNGQASGSLHPLLSLLAVYGRYACFRKMEMQGKLYKQLPSYERSNKTSKLQKFLMQQANCQGTVTFSVCSDAPKVID